MAKSRNFGLFLIVILIYSTICMETDIYVPAFPDMRHFFGVSDELIQRVLSLNFFGICLGSLLLAPLADRWGRRLTLLLGLGIFTIASWGCLVFQDFGPFLACRFLQGIGAAAPMTCGFAIILDLFEGKRVSQIVGGLNLFITATMAGSPILGAWLNLAYGWQSNFLCVAVLATVTLVGSFFLIPESLPADKRVRLTPLQTLQSFWQTLTSFPYMASALVCYLLFGSFILFTANLSLIFIEYLDVPKESYGFYQAATTLTFAIVSALSIFIIEHWGTNRTKYAGLVLSTIGAFLLLGVAFYEPTPVLICGAAIVFIAGSTLAAPIYGVESASMFADMRGIATGMSNALRHVSVASLVGIGSLAFNGSILPVAWLIVGSVMLSLVLALALRTQPTPEETLHPQEELA